MLSLQQNMDDIVTTWLMTSGTETNNLDNSKQDRSSNRGMICDFDGINRHLLPNLPLHHDNSDLQCKCKQHISPWNYHKAREHLYFCFRICKVLGDLQAPLQALSVP